MDIMLKPEQRIENLLTVLRESGRLQAEGRLFLRSWRLGTYLDTALSFEQSGILTGDIIYIEREEDQ